MVFLMGLAGGFMVAMATVIGALPSLFKTRKGMPISAHLSIDFALGMMLAASAFSLILPAGEQVVERGEQALQLALLSLVAGAGFIFGLGRLGARFSPVSKVPTGAIDASASESGLVKRTRNGWLFIVAMMLHNLPEGLASGAALSGLDWRAALPLIGVIAVQNLPEGLTTAVSFQSLGFSARLAFVGAALSAAVEFVGGGLGGALLAWVNEALPYTLAFAGGAMLFVSVAELSARYGEQASAALRLRMARDLSLGMGAMYVMDRLL